VLIAMFEVVAAQSRLQRGLSAVFG
jgi:hypothetical protein